MNTNLFFKICLFLLFLAEVRADYVLDLTGSTNNASRLTISPGDTFTLDAQLTSTNSHKINVAIFRLEFSKPGLLYQSYTWRPPFPNGTIDDDSRPLLTSLPVDISADLLAGPDYPAGIADLELSNVVNTDQLFSAGAVARLTFKAPASLTGKSVTITPVPVAVANGFTIVPITAGKTVQVDISGLRILSVSRSGQNTTLAWSGGVGPFILQTKTALSDPAWQNSLQIATRSTTILSTTSTGFFRILDLGASQLP